MDIEWIFRRVNVEIDYRGAQWKGGRMKSGRKWRRWGAWRWLLKLTRNEEPWRLQKLGLFKKKKKNFVRLPLLSSPRTSDFCGGRLKREGGTASEEFNNPRRCRNSRILLASSSSFVYERKEASYLGVLGYFFITWKWWIWLGGEQFWKWVNNCLIWVFFFLQWGIRTNLRATIEILKFVKKVYWQEPSFH